MKWWWSSLNLHSSCCSDLWELPAVSPRGSWECALWAAESFSPPTVHQILLTLLYMPRVPQGSFVLFFFPTLWAALFCDGPQSDFMIFASLLVREPALSFPLVMGFSKQLYIAVSVDVPWTKTLHMTGLVYHSNTHTLKHTSATCHNSQRN